MIQTRIYYKLRSFPEWRTKKKATTKRCIILIIIIVKEFKMHFCKIWIQRKKNEIKPFLKFTKWKTKSSTEPFAGLSWRPSILSVTSRRGSFTNSDHYIGETTRLRRRRWWENGYKRMRYSDGVGVGRREHLQYKIH